MEDAALSRPRLHVNNGPMTLVCIVGCRLAPPLSGPLAPSRFQRRGPPSRAGATRSAPTRRSAACIAVRGSREAACAQCASAANPPRASSPAPAPASTPAPRQAPAAVYFRTAAPRSFPLANAAQSNVAERLRLRREVPRSPAPRRHLKSLAAEEGGEAESLSEPSCMRAAIVRGL